MGAFMYLNNLISNVVNAKNQVNPEERCKHHFHDDLQHVLLYYRRSRENGLGGNAECSVVVYVFGPAYVVSMIHIPNRFSLGL